MRSRSASLTKLLNGGRCFLLLFFPLARSTFSIRQSKSAAAASAWRRRRRVHGGRDRRDGAGAPCANCHRRVTARRAGWSRLAGDVDDPRRGFRAPGAGTCGSCTRCSLRAGASIAARRTRSCWSSTMSARSAGEISTMVWNVGLSRRSRPEIAECELRCCNCHRRITAPAPPVRSRSRLYSLIRAAVAQLVEQPRLLLNRSRAGSSPAGGIAMAETIRSIIALAGAVIMVCDPRVLHRLRARRSRARRRGSHATSTSTVTGPTRRPRPERAAGSRAAPTLRRASPPWCSG